MSLQAGGFLIQVIANAGKVFVMYNFLKSKIIYNVKNIKWRRKLFTKQGTDIRSFFFIFFLQYTHIT